MTARWNGVAHITTILLTLVLALPTAAHAGDKSLTNAGQCAVRYMQANLSRQAPSLIADFERIRRQDRAWDVIRAHELIPLISDSFPQDINSFARGQTTHLSIGRHADALLVYEMPLHEELDSGNQSRQEAAIAALAACDQAHGFKPITALAPAHRISDLDCAAVYWLRGAMNPLERDAAGQRAQFALGRHQAANADIPTEKLIEQMQAEGNARYERIMLEARGLEEIRQAMIKDGENPDDARALDRLQRRAIEARRFQQDMTDCEVKYGFRQHSGH